MGGMFDPVHNGHGLLAQSARQYCQLDSVKMFPCGTPVHRSNAVAAAEHREAMLKLACGDHDWLQIDKRECASAAPSYTYHTVSALRAEHPSATLFLLLGLDAFLALDTWYRWQDLFALVHMVVAVRPGYKFEPGTLAPAFRQVVGARLAGQANDAAQHAAGRILLVALDLPDISSTQVRRLVHAGEDISALVPAAVADYIAAKALYK